MRYEKKKNRKKNDNKSKIITKFYINEDCILVIYQIQLYVVM